MATILYAPPLKAFIVTKIIMISHQRKLKLLADTPAASEINTASNSEGPNLAPARLGLRLTLVVAWGLLLSLGVVSLAFPQKARAQGGSEQISDGIELVRSTKHGRTAVTFKVTKVHSGFRYYDKTEGDTCAMTRTSNRVWFEYYLANPRDDTEPARQSYDYTIYHRDSSKKICILIVWGDYRVAGAGGFFFGPFSFQASPPAEKKPVVKPDPPATKQTIEVTINYDQNLELPDDSRLSVELRDTSFQDSDSILIARQVLEDFGRPPHKVKLEYDSQKIKDRNTYSIGVRVVDAADRLLLHNDTALDVITWGNPKNKVQTDLVPTRHLTPKPQPEKTTPPPVTSPSIRITKPTPPPPAPAPKPQTTAPQPQPITPAEAPAPTAIDHPPTAPEQNLDATDPAIPEVAIAPHETLAISPPETNPTPVIVTSDNQSQLGKFIWLGGYVLLVIVAGLIGLKLIDHLPGGQGKKTD